MSSENTQSELFAPDVDALSAAYEKWYNGSRRESEIELANFLGQVVALVRRLKAAGAEERQAFTDLLIARDIKCQSNTSLVRKAFLAAGCKNSLIDGYVTVVTKALADMKPGETMLQYIDRKGGIEVIRRSNGDGVSKAEQDKAHRSLAAQEYSVVAGIGEPFEPTAEITPKDDGDFDFAVALVRLQANGKAIIAGGTNDQTLVATALTTIGKSIDAKIEAKALAAAKEAAFAERQRILGAVPSMETPDTVDEQLDDGEDHRATTVAPVDAA